jgi:hypothetical protein
MPCRPPVLSLPQSLPSLSFPQRARASTLGIHISFDILHRRTKETIWPKRVPARGPQGLAMRDTPAQGKDLAPVTVLHVSVYFNHLRPYKLAPVR